MNSKTIRKIIKEELQKLLITEKFQSKDLTDLYRLLNAGRWSNGKQIFDKMAKWKKFDWANVPDKAVNVSASGNSGNNVMNVFVVTKEKKNIRSTAWHATIYPGLLGMTLGKKVLASNGTIVDKRGERAGADYTTKGIHNFKAFNEFADRVYQIDINQIPSSADIQSKRAEAKKGATALMQARDILRSNKQRYQAALTMKAGEGGWKSARDMAKRATEALTKAVENHTAMLSKGMYMTTWSNEYASASHLYAQVMKHFLDFQEANKSAMKIKDERGKGYQLDRMAGSLKAMKDEFIEFTKKLKELEKAKPVPIQGRSW